MAGLPHRVFVYGTLKRGFENYRRYLGIAEACRKAAFVADALTIEKFALVVRPSDLPPSTRGPVLMDIREGDAHPSGPAGAGCETYTGSTHEIEGEVYDMDASTFEAMDILEGVKSNYYYRREVSVRSKAGGDLSCTAYFYRAHPQLLALPTFSSYNVEHHDLYRPPPVNDEILALCRGSHGLCTPLPCPLQAQCLRLLPGEDVVLCLRAFAARHRLKAAVVLSCVGSTGRTTLRPAGVPEARVFEGKFEILSLSGTVSASGHHLHLCIGDSACQVVGGHALEGCIVRTTAEITLGILGGVQFSRPVDTRTGYDELSMMPLSEADVSEPSGKRQRTD